MTITDLNAFLIALSDEYDVTVTLKHQSGLTSVKTIRRI